MDNLIKELVEDFKKQKDKVEKESEKFNNEAKIVAKVNKRGDVEALEIVGQQTVVLSLICAILKITAKNSDDSAERLATIILTALEMEKELND